MVSTFNYFYTFISTQYFYGFLIYIHSKVFLYTTQSFVFALFKIFKTFDTKLFALSHTRFV